MRPIGQFYIICTIRRLDRYFKMLFHLDTHRDRPGPAPLVYIPSFFSNPIQILGPERICLTVKQSFLSVNLSWAQNLCLAFILGDSIISTLIVGRFSARDVRRLAYKYS